MNIIIRQETEKDYKLSETVVEKAFKDIEHSDHKEQFLVSKLRKGDAFIPELCLVAEINDEIVGHIMLTKLLIKEGENRHESFMTLELEEGSLDGVTGTVVYSKEFFE